MKHFGRYQAERELGRGGMATVYLGFDPAIKRQVAIKVLPRQFTFDPQFRVRFDQEAQLVAALDHYAIVPIYDFGEHEDQPYIVMRYMTGGSLSDRLEQGPLPTEQVLAIINRLSSALERAHSQGVIHRDLKPGNVLFDSDDNAYLSDFGIAKVATTTAELTGSGIIGTPAYMSPEQAQGIAPLDGRTDVYSLGLILFEMLTGKQPYEADTPVQLALKQVTEPLPNILIHRPDLPEGAQRVMEKALAKDRADRFPTPSEFNRSLQLMESPTHYRPPAGPGEPEASPSTLQGTRPEPVGAERVERRVRPASAGFAAESSRQPQLEPASARVKPSRGIPGWLIAGAAVMVLAGAAVLLVAIQSGWVSSLIAAVEPDQRTGEPTRAISTPAQTQEKETPLADVTPLHTSAPDLASLATETSLPGWQELYVLPADAGPTYGLAWSLDGGLLATASDRKIALWTEGGEEASWDPGLAEPPRRVIWSSDLDRIALVIDPFTLSVRDARSGVVLFERNSGNDIAWSPDGGRLAISSGSTVDVLDGQSGQELVQMPPTSSGITWLPNGRTILTALTFSVSTWDTDTGRILDRNTGTCASGYFLVPSPDGVYFACPGVVTVYNERYPSGVIQQDNTVRLWTADPLQEHMTLAGHARPAISASWSPDGRILATVGEDAALILWQMETATELRRWTGQVGPAVWSQDGRYLTSLGSDGVRRVWDSENGEELVSFSNASGPAAWSPTGIRIAWAAADGTIRVWGNE